LLTAPTIQMHLTSPAVDTIDRVLGLAGGHCVIPLYVVFLYILPKIKCCIITSFILLFFVRGTIVAYFAKFNHYLSIIFNHLFTYRGPYQYGNILMMLGVFIA
jgi:hypothetical protein